jgi:hypothetical protein
VLAAAPRFSVLAVDSRAVLRYKARSSSEEDCIERPDPRCEAGQRVMSATGQTAPQRVPPPYHGSLSLAAGASSRGPVAADAVVPAIRVFPATGSRELPAVARRLHFGAIQSKRLATLTQYP